MKQANHTRILVRGHSYSVKQLFLIRPVYGQFADMEVVNKVL